MYTLNLHADPELYKIQLVELQYNNTIIVVICWQFPKPLWQELHGILAFIQYEMFTLRLITVGWANQQLDALN